MFDFLSSSTMSELAPFVTGLFIGLTAAFIFKGRSKDLPKELARTTKLIKAAVKGKGDYKMVFVVRNDLGMSKGKIATQCAHATLLCHDLASESCPEGLKLWSRTGQAKIAVKLDGDGEKEILKLAEKANKLGIVYSLVKDAGRTQIKSGTVTVLGLGPSPAELINEVSGHLKLL